MSTIKFKKRFFEVYDTDSPVGEVWPLKIYFVKDLFIYIKPTVTKKSILDFPDKKTYNQIAQLRTGYAKCNV